jgi:hypothetical protein
MDLSVICGGSNDAEAIFRRRYIGDIAVEMAIRTAGISDATYYKWRKRYGGMGKSKLREFKSLAVTRLISASGAGSENSTAPLL